MLTGEHLMEIEIKDDIWTDETVYIDGVAIDKWTHDTALEEAIEHVENALELLINQRENSK